jgi:hypothetical protein
MMISFLKIGDKKIIKTSVVLISLLLLIGCAGNTLVTHLPSQTAKTAFTLTNGTPKTPLPTSTYSGTIKSKYISIIVRTNGKIYIEDTELQPINLFPAEYKYYSTSNMCDLNGILDLRDELQTGVLDLDGIVKETRSIRLTENSLDNAYQFSVSPSGEWISYKAVSDIGQSYADARVQNVRLVKADEAATNKPVEVTTSGRAWPAKVVWSPDGRYLAYADIDQNNITQIYIYEPETNKKKQISQFGLDETDLYISDIKWSLDSSKLAFSAIFADENNGDLIFKKGKAGILDLHSGKIQSPEFNNLNPKIQQFWWGEEGNIIFLVDSKSTGTFLVWYDTKTDTNLDQVKPSDLDSTSEFYYTYPITTDLDAVGILLGDDTYIYKRNEKSFSKVETNLFDGFFEIITTPSGNSVPFSCEY